MTNAERLEKLREAMGKLDIPTSTREDRMEEIALITAEEICKIGEVFQKNINIYHIGDVK